MKKNILLVMAWLVCSFAYGQGEVEAVLFSGQDLQGTARAQAMGGAFGALGGDISGVAINPAGLGVYTSSEVTATISLDNLKYKLGMESSTHTNFRFDNISYVGYFPLSNSGMSVLNFAFNYNRTKTFNREYSGRSNNRSASLLDRIVINTEGIDYRDLGASNAFRQPDIPWLSILGWETYLINRVNGSNSSYEPILYNDELVDSHLSISEEGGIDAYEISLGTAIENKLYLGFSFAFTDISYLQYSTYGEDFHATNAGFNLDNYLETKGSGYHLKLGAIYRPVDELRLGVAFHSPTWYSMTDYYQAVMTPYGIRIDNGALAGSYRTPDRDANQGKDYKYQTPSSWVFSAAGVIAQRALVSVDYKLTDYSLSSFKDDGGRAHTTDNKQIKKHQKVASTVNAGLEYRFTPQFSGRLGYAWYQNPYEDNVSDGEVEIFTAGTVAHYTIDGNVNYFTAGFGYRFTPQFYLDAAFVYGQQDSKQYYFSPVYDGPDLSNLYMESVPEDLKKQSYKALLTLGYKF